MNVLCFTNKVLHTVTVKFIHAASHFMTKDLQAFTDHNTNAANPSNILTPCRDYRPNEMLDAYEEEGIDEVDEADITMEERLAARRQADRELNKRDRRENRGGFPGALNGESHWPLSPSFATVSTQM